MEYKIKKGVIFKGISEKNIDSKQEIVTNLIKNHSDLLGKVFFEVIEDKKEVVKVEKLEEAKQDEPITKATEKPNTEKLESDKPTKSKRK